MSNWDSRFMALAAHVATWSKDPSTKVGAVIVRPDRTVASLGYNGPPRGVSDALSFADRHRKLARTIHAELNAILSSHVPVAGYTLYVTLPPCDRCAAHIVQAGLRRVVTSVSSASDYPDRWALEIAEARQIFMEAGVVLDAQVRVA